MGVLHPHPIGFLLGARHPDLVVRRTPPPLDEHPCVDDVGEDPLDGHILPLRPLLCAERRFKARALHPLVLHRRGDAAGVEPPCDFQDGETVLIHPEDHRHDLGRHLVHQQAVFILRGFPVSEGDEAAHILALFALDLQAGAYLDGDIAAVDVVYQIAEGQCDVVRAASGRHTVIVVVDGDIPDAHGREDLFQIVSGIDIVAGKPAQILADGAVDPAGAHILKHPLEAGAVGVAAGLSIVDICVHQLQIVMAFYVSQTDRPLALDAVALAAVSILSG